MFTLGRLYDHLLPPDEIDLLKTGEIRLATAGLITRVGDLPQRGEEEEEEEEGEEEEEQENGDGGKGSRVSGRGSTVRISR